MRSENQPTLRPLIRESSLYGAGLALARGLSTLVTPLLARVFTPSEFGLLELLQTVAGLCSMLLSLYMESALLRYFPEERDKGLLVSTYMFTQLGLSAAFLVTLGILAPHAAAWIGLPDVTPLWAAAFSVVATLSYTHALTLLRAQRAASLAASVIAANAALNVLLLIGLFALFAPSLALIFTAKALADLASTTAVVWSQRSLYGCRYSLAAALRFLRFGLPLLPEGLVAFAGAHTTKLYLLQYASLADLGMLGLANRLGGVIRLFLAAFRQAWQPFAFSIQDSGAVDIVVIRAFRFYSRAALIGLLVFSLSAREILLIFASPHYLPALPLVPATAAAIVVGGLPYVFSIGLLLEGKTYYYTLATLLASATSAGSAWWLVSQYGVLGAPFASLLGSVTFAIVVFVASKKVRAGPYETTPVITFIAAATTVAVAGALGIADCHPITRMGLVSIAAVTGLWGRGFCRAIWTGKIARLKRRAKHDSGL